MKKLLLFSFGFSMAFSVPAQITLTQSNVPRSSSYLDIRHKDISGINVPAQGANMTYNYTSLSGSSVDTIPYKPATRNGFTSFTRFNYGSSNLNNIPLYSEYYSRLDASGLARVGSYKLEQKVALGTITGNNSDTLKFPGNASIFSQPAYEIQFPATYGDHWSSDYVYTTNFQLTVSAFGLSNTPGYQKEDVHQEDSIVGWGQLTIPTAGGSSVPYDVLLIKQSRVYSDSIFLGGAPAPAALINAFGLTQGQISQLNRYAFYAENFERPLLIIEMSANWQTAERSFYGSVGVGTINLADMPYANKIKVYPNPVKPSSVLKFDGTPKNVSIKLTIYNAIGIPVCEKILASGQSGTLKWEVPSDIGAGAYFYTLGDLQNKIYDSGKLTVR